MSSANGLLLRIEGLSVAYGDVQVLWGVDLDVREGETVALIGSNGAGKTTLLRTISGLLRPTTGSITFDQRRIDRSSTHHIVAAGIAHVPEGRLVFPAMSVRDHLLLGAFQRRDRAAVGADVARMLELFPRLAERLHALAATLSGGEQQMVAIARALMARPRLLMIDELSLGLAPIIVESLMPIIAAVQAAGTTILLVEQDAQLALERASRGYVLESGRVALSGDSATLLRDDRVRQAYLGV